MSANPPPTYMVYVGTFTSMSPHPRGRAEGIYVFGWDPEAVTMAPVQVVKGVHSPSYLNLAPDGQHLYAVNAVPEIDGHPGGAVSAFAVAPGSGELTYLNRQSSHGGGPCYVRVDQSGRWALVSNYFSGSAAVLPIQPDGSLGPATDVVQHEGSGSNPDRQAGPHAHSINPDLSERCVLVCDLGLDRVAIYQFDRQHGKLTPNPVEPYAGTRPASGPRHLDFHPSGRYVYVIDELDSTITAFEYDPNRGALAAIQNISTLPDGYPGANSTADIHVHPSGRFVLGSNRGADTLAIFAIDPKNGRLTAVGAEPTRGKTPRNFTFDPSGQIVLVANQDSDNLVQFRFDDQSGALDFVGEVAQVPSPSCIKLLKG